MKARLGYKPKQRDPHAGREDARRFAANVSTGLLIVGAIIALVVVANRWLDREGVTGVRIVGRVVLDSTEIVGQADIRDDVPVRKLDLQAIENRIAAHPFIARASVYRGETGMLVVEIAERVPVAVTFINGMPLYLDSAAVLLPYRFSAAGFDVPVISGIDSANGIDSVHALESLGIVRALRDFDDVLYRRISEVRREPNGEYTLIAADGAVAIRAGRSQSVLSRLTKLDAFMTQVIGTRGHSNITYVDLRWDGQVVVMNNG